MVKLRGKVVHMNIYLNLLGSIVVFFSPRGGCERAIVEAINQSRTSVLMQAYQLTDEPIGIALSQAQARGVAVTVIIDGKEGSAFAVPTRLKTNHVEVLSDRAHSKAHNKIIIVDRALVITGSFNFSGNAERNNAENLLFIREPAVTQSYLTNFFTHRAHSTHF